MKKRGEIADKIVDGCLEGYLTHQEALEKLSAIDITESPKKFKPEDMDTFMSRFTNPDLEPYLCLIQDGWLHGAKFAQVRTEQKAVEFAQWTDTQTEYKREGGMWRRLNTRLTFSYQELYEIWKDNN